MIQYKEILTASQIYNCLTSTLATLCREQNFNFELMFLEDWKFQYHQTSEDLVGGRINRNNTKYYDTLLKYHNVQVINEKVKSLQTFKEKFYQNEKKHGCAVVYDTFYCPWVYNYQKEHQKHYSLALGFQPNGKFYCCDTVPYSESTELPLQDLLRSEFSVVTLNRIEERKKPIDYALIIKSLAAEYLEKSEGAQSIFTYADFIEKNFYIKHENLYCGTNFWIMAPFLLDLEAIMRSRASFCCALNYLVNTYAENSFYKSAQERFHDISNGWYTTFLSSWKMFLTPDYDNNEARQELSSAIYNLADMEKRVAEELLIQEVSK